MHILTWSGIALFVVGLILYHKPIYTQLKFDLRYFVYQRRLVQLRIAAGGVENPLDEGMPGERWELAILKLFDLGVARYPADQLLVSDDRLAALVKLGNGLFDQYLQSYVRTNSIIIKSKHKEFENAVSDMLFARIQLEEVTTQVSLRTPMKSSSYHLSLTEELSYFGERAIKLRQRIAQIKQYMNSPS